MSAGIYNITIEQGTLFELLTVYATDAEGLLPIDLTGWAGRGQIRKKASDTDVAGTFVISIPSPLLGEVKIVLSAASTSALVLKGSGYNDLVVYYYDIELYKISEPENVFRYLNGTASISPEVTK